MNISKTENTQIQKDKKTVGLLDSLIKKYRLEGLKNVQPDCNSFGNPALNLLYGEVYQCCTNNRPLLTLVGCGVFLEELTKEIWVSSQVHRLQISGRFKSWEDVMIFTEKQHEAVENKKIEYKKDIKPVLERTIDREDLESLELLRGLVRNTFVHSKRRRLIEALQDNNILPLKMPVGKLDIASGKISRKEFHLTHPLVVNLGFIALAKQIAPAMLIFTFEIFKKYHKQLAPLEDKKIKYVGHSCDYD